MDILQWIISELSEFVWGPVMIVLLVGTGIYLTVMTRAVQIRKMPEAFRLLMHSNPDEQGDITPFQALMTSMSATIGTGNIAGVATAIASGGPGAIFWMWVTGVVGGALKFGEASLAIQYRITNVNGQQSGGPMYYIQNGMRERFGGNWTWLAVAFAIFGLMASFGIGNVAQANSVAKALENSFDISPFLTGLVMAVAVWLVIIGGIQSIGRATSKLVPFMSLIYILSALSVLIVCYDHVDQAFMMIFDNAFSGQAVGGGLLGSVIRFGVARGVFSNEAGLGSAPIAHAASRVQNPVTQGLVASLGSFLDTLVICTMTALVILVSGLVSLDSTGLMHIDQELTGAALTSTAFSQVLGNVGEYAVTFGLVFFAFSTIMGWSYYGSKCFEYLAGTRAVKGYYWVFAIAVFVGSTSSLEVVWNLSDVFNGLMAIPNLIALLALSPVILGLLKDYEAK